MTRQAKPAGDRRVKDRYTLSGGIPWPTLGDGAPYVLKGDNAPVRVRHADLTHETGTLQWVEWCHPDGSYMPGDRMKAATKTKAAEPKPGAWWGVVAWDGRDEPGREPILARHPLRNLATETVE